MTGMLGSIMSALTSDKDMRIAPKQSTVILAKAATIYQTVHTLLADLMKIFIIFQKLELTWNRMIFHAN